MTIIARIKAGHFNRHPVCSDFDSKEAAFKKAVLEETGFGDHPKKEAIYKHASSVVSNYDPMLLEDCKRTDLHILSVLEQLAVLFNGRSMN